MKMFLSCIYLQGYTVRSSSIDQSNSNVICPSSGQPQQVQMIQELSDGQLVQRPLTIDGVNVRRAIY